MQIRKIVINNFKSISDPLTIDFSAVRGFWKIGGDIGAGKTTIGEAILYGLFGDIAGKNNTDLVTWGKKKGQIEVWLTSQKHDIYIRRELRLQGQSELYVTVDNEELMFTNKRDAQKQLETEYYDVSRMTLELLCIISFNNFKSLATLNTADSKAFLDQVFGFYVLTNYGNICKELLSDSTGMITTVNNNIISLNGQIEKIRKLMNTEVIEGNIENLRTENAALTRQATAKREERRKLSEEFQKSTSSLAAQLGSIKTMGQNKAKEISFIEQGVCPTGGAPIKQDNLGQLRKEKEVLGDQYRLINSELQRLTGEKNSKDSELERTLRAINTKITENTTRIGQLEQQEKRMAINGDEIQKIESQIDEQNTLLTQYQRDQQEWKSLYNIITVDVRQKILSSFIPLLNDSISHYAKQLQLRYVIRFDENFKCHIELIGAEKPIPISGLSTGQLKTVDISIILGVLRTITRGANFNILFLDELLSNMHDELRNQICSVIKRDINADQTIFIITHTEIEKDYFNGEIKTTLHYDNFMPRSEYEITHYRK